MPHADGRHNGTRIHDNVELPGPTGAGAREAPGARPIRLQDQGNRVKFRNVWVLERTSNPGL